MVKYAVDAQMAEAPKRVGIADLMACGLGELVRSLDRYEPSEDATLEQFVWGQIQSAVRGELGGHARAPRSTRRRSRSRPRARRDAALAQAAEAAITG